MKKILMEILRLLWKAALLVFLKWIRPKLGKLLLAMFLLGAVVVALIGLLLAAC